MRIFVILSLLLLQQAASPPLQQRGNDVRQPQATFEGSTTLPEAASGEYLPDSPGDIIEIDIANGKIGGYVSVLEGKGDKAGTPGTFLFADVKASGDHLSFTTRQIHGTAYVFDGIIERGKKKGPKAASYVLEGKLTESNSGENSSKTRTVNLKLLPTFAVE